MKPLSCRLSLKVTPGSRCNEVLGEQDGAVRIKLRAPPADGRANAALLALLAEKLQVAKADLCLVSGAGTRRKIVAIQGLAIDEARRRLLGTA